MSSDSSVNKSDLFIFVVPEHVKNSGVNPEIQRASCHLLPVNRKEEVMFNVYLKNKKKLI